VDFTKKNCENYTQDIYEKVSRDLGSGFKMIREIAMHGYTHVYDRICKISK